MKVVVFGGRKPNPGEADYQQAEELGRLLAEAGHTVITGGYMGVMEAALKGARQAGGHTIGVTCLELERWRGGQANPWVLEEIKSPTLHERMIHMMDIADAAIALPGGIGTLAEISLLWNRLLIEACSPKPLILVGSGWERILDVCTEQDGYFPLGDRRFLRFASDAHSALEQLNAAL